MIRNAWVVIGIAITVFQGCGTVSNKEDNRPCMTNYQMQGDFFSGKQFTTFQDFPRVTANSAFESVLAAVASSRLQITNTNKELGIISAASPISSFSSGGRTVPFSAVIKSNPSGGVRVSLQLSPSGGLNTHDEKIQEEFCKILASVFTGTAKSESGVAVPKPTGTNGANTASENSSMQKMTIRQGQQRLSELGYKPGAVDGKMGPSTVNALKKFQHDNKLAETGKLDDETAIKLQNSK